VADIALSLLEGAVGVLVFFLKIGMTFEAGTAKVLLQQSFRVRGVRGMACNTLPFTDRCMNNTGCKCFLLFFMTGITELANFFF
jgi:hypothetical protein